AVWREPLLPPRDQPLDRDAAGAGGDARRRRLRVSPEAARRLPRSAELVGAGPALAHRVGLSAVPRHARAVPEPYPEGVLPPQLLGCGGRQRTGDRGDRRADRRRPDVRLQRLSALRLKLPERVQQRDEELLARNRGADLHGRCASLRNHGRGLPEGGQGGGRGQESGRPPRGVTPKADYRFFTGG